LANGLRRLDQLLIATKFTTCYPSGKGGERIMANYQGNLAKSLQISLDASLKKLQSSYIDRVCFESSITRPQSDLIRKSLHPLWDFTTSIPELMQSLNRMVDAGKVLYLGISETPAWVVSKANKYALCHGLTQFSVYQGNWNAALSDFRCDIIPMCESEGMGIAPWGVLGSETLKSKAQREKADPEGRKPYFSADRTLPVSEKLVEIADKKGTVIQSVVCHFQSSKYKTCYVLD
jgi:aryl-alcohol dehydrogenase-like predicted oxidoreductase